MKKKVIEGKSLGFLEGYNSFMYRDSKQRNERIVARKTTIQNEIEKQQQEKEAEKAARKAERQAQKEQAKAEREQKRLERQQAFEENTEEEENRRIFFSKEDGEEIEATVIDVNQLYDEKFSKFEKSPKGMDLMKRNLNASKMYICDDDDFMRVQKIKEVETEAQDFSKVYLLLDTNREYYVIGFDCIRTF